MKQRLHTTNIKQKKDKITITIDIASIPSMDRKYSRLRNRAQVFEDRRFKKPKYKTIDWWIVHNLFTK